MCYIISMAQETNPQPAPLRPDIIRPQVRPLGIDQLRANLERRQFPPELLEKLGSEKAGSLKMGAYFDYAQRELLDTQIRRRRDLDLRREHGNAEPEPDMQKIMGENLDDLVSQRGALRETMRVKSIAQMPGNTKLHWTKQEMSTQYIRQMLRKSRLNREGRILEMLTLWINLCKPIAECIRMCST